MYPSMPKTRRGDKNHKKQLQISFGESTGKLGVGKKVYPFLKYFFFKFSSQVHILLLF